MLCWSDRGDIKVTKKAFKRVLRLDWGFENK